MRMKKKTSSRKSKIFEPTATENKNATTEEVQAIIPKIKLLVGYIWTILRPRYTRILAEQTNVLFSVVIENRVCISADEDEWYFLLFYAFTD